MTRAEQRLNSNHGRFVRAACAVPERLRLVPMPGSGWTPREVVAHVAIWQEEALRHLAEPDVPWPERAELDAWNVAAVRALRHLSWEEALARLEANHAALRAWLHVDPPRWFGACTYWHYTEHTRALLAFLRAFDQSVTTTVAPIAAQS